MHISMSPAFWALRSRDAAAACSAAFLSLCRDAPIDARGPVLCEPGDARSETGDTASWQPMPRRCTLQVRSQYRTDDADAKPRRAPKGEQDSLVSTLDPYLLELIETINN